MRVILFILVMISFTSVKAQTLLPTNYHSGIDSNNADKKWTLQKYGGISASYAFFNGGNARVISAPVGLQLNRRINNNLYAFAGIAAAPAYIDFNRSFTQADINKNMTGINRYNANGFSMISKFEAGLTYINDAKTFSISGSIGVYESTFPGYPSFNRDNTQRQQPVINTRQ